MDLSNIETLRPRPALIGRSPNGSPFKPKVLAWQAEYRLVVGRKGAFTVENVDLALEGGSGQLAVAEVGKPLILSVGDLSRVAQLHRF